MKKMDKIKLIVLDVDGTMTDGGVYIDSNGVELKKFNIKDGAGILMAEAVGIDFMILTGRKSVCVEKRAKELKIKYLEQNVSDKGSFLKKFIDDNLLDKTEIAYIGDDLNDLSCMKMIGVSACPIDAVDEIKEVCDFVLPIKGGNGVIRAFVELLLKSNNLFGKAQSLLFK